MRILFASYNIQFGFGQDGRYDIARVAEVVKDCDIVCFQEVAQHWRRNDHDDQAKVLAEAMNAHVSFGPLYDLDASYPDAAGRVVNRRRTFGNMVASRWPIRSARTLALPKHATAEVSDVHRCVVEAVVATPAGPLRVYSVHLSHLSASQRLPQARALRDIVRDAPVSGAAFDGVQDEFWSEGWTSPNPPAPVIVAGDFNCRADSAEYAELCGQATPSYGRIRQHDQLVDTWTAAGHDALGPTSFFKFRDNYKIDHVLASADVARSVTRAWIDTTAVASDHYPLFVEFDWAS